MDQETSELQVKKPDIQPPSRSKEARLFLSPTVRTMGVLIVAAVTSALGGCAQSASQRREQAKLKAEAVGQEFSSTDDRARKDELWEEILKQGHNIIHQANYVQEHGDKEQARTLYSQASEALEIEGYPDEAADAAIKAGDQERAQELYLEASEEWEAQGNFWRAAMDAESAKDNERAAAMYVRNSQSWEASGASGNLAEAISFMDGAMRLDPNNEEYIARWRELHKNYSLEMEFRNILTTAAQSAAKSGDTQRAKDLYVRLSVKLERKGELMDQIIDAQNNKDADAVERLRASLEITIEEYKQGGYYAAAANASREAGNDEREKLLYGKAAVQSEKQSDLNDALHFFALARDEENKRRIAVILSAKEESEGNFISAARSAEDAHDDVRRIKGLWRQAWVKSVNERNYDDARWIEERMIEKGYIASADELYGVLGK